jgi:hypothetical protein
MVNANQADIQKLNKAVQQLTQQLQDQGTLVATIPTFYGGDQDPIAWLNEFNLACAANGWNEERKLQIAPSYLKSDAAVWHQSLAPAAIANWNNGGNADNVNNFEDQFLQQFWTDVVIDTWITKLEQRVQKPDESVNQYASDIQKLFQRVGKNYTDFYKTRKFVSGLHRELYIMVKPFGDATLQAAIDRAEVCELTISVGKNKMMNYTDNNNAQLEVLVNLMTDLVNHVLRLQERVDRQERVNSRRPRYGGSHWNGNGNDVNSSVKWK